MTETRNRKIILWCILGIVMGIILSEILFHASGFHPVADLLTMIFG